ncbi:sunset domain-containing protein [Umezawaea beigongshangensis]|uniref:sunset domain-containing protein n=1 Tax=Umezawaea beigongshangensis TaxID=2780383 RepID=UPI0018F1DEDD|nr:hypothetical protein [Umezawaea beigongshangensis]
MFWLFSQVFALCAVAFAAGALLTWLPMRVALRRASARGAVVRTSSAALLPVAREPERPVERDAGEPEVKGNSKSMICHTPSSPYFRRMKGDVSFRSAEDAVRAGYTLWTPRPRGGADAERTRASSSALS